MLHMYHVKLIPISRPDNNGVMTVELLDVLWLKQTLPLTPEMLYLAFASRPTQRKKMVDMNLHA